MLAYLILEYNRRRLLDEKAEMHEYLTALQTRKNQLRGRVFNNKEDVEYIAKLFQREFGRIPPREIRKGFNPVRKVGCK